MEVDIYSYRGVVVTESQMVLIIHDKNHEQACRALLRHVVTIMDTLRQDNDREELDDRDLRSLKEQAKLLTLCFRYLTMDSSVSDIRNQLLSMTKWVADGFDSYVENSDLAIEVWSMLVKQLYPEAPTPESIEFIDSPGDQGGDLPTGEVLYVFSEDECFELVKTQAGSALDEMLGEKTNLSSWAGYSV